MHTSRTTQIMLRCSMRDRSTSGIPTVTLSPTLISVSRDRALFTMRSACSPCRWRACRLSAAARVSLASRHGHWPPSSTCRPQSAQMTALLVDGRFRASPRASSVCSTEDTAAGRVVEASPSFGSVPNMATYGDRPMPALTCNTGCRRLNHKCISNDWHQTNHLQSR